MAVFSVTIPDADVDRVIIAMCANYRYSSTVPNPEYDESLREEDEGFDPDIPHVIDNPETQHQFANRMTREFLTDNTQAYEIRLAKETALNSVPTPPAIEDASDASSSSSSSDSIYG